MSWTPVNSSSGSGGGSSSTVAASAIAVTAGNTIIVGVGSNIAQSVLSIADTAGNTYVSAAFQAASGSHNVEIWFCATAIANASNIVTVTFTAAVTDRDIHVLQYTPPDAVVTCETGATGFSGTAPTSSSFSPAAAGNLNIAVCGSNNGAATFSASAGYTVEVTTHAGGSFDTGTADNVNAAAGAQTVTMTPSAGNVMQMSVASFKAAPVPVPIRVGTPAWRGSPAPRRHLPW